MLKNQIDQLNSELDQENSSSLLLPSIKDQVAYLKETIQSHENIIIALNP